MEPPVTWRAVPALALLMTFILVTLGGAAHAQSGSVPDTLLPGAVNETEVVTDAEGDVAVSGFLIGGPPSPPTDLDAPVDIISLRIAETEADLLFSLQHRGYPATAAQLYSNDPAYSYSCSMDFRAGDRGYSIFMYRDFGQSTAWGVRSELWSWDDESEGDQELDAALVNDDHFEAVLPKAMLRYGEEGRGLRVGDSLTDFYIWCSQGGIALRTYDYYFEGGPAFRVTLAAGTADVSIQFPGAGTAGISVLPGETNRFAVDLVNLADRKLLINFTAQLVDDTGAPMTDWVVHHAHDLEVKRGGTVSASVVVTPPADTAHREGGILKVRALPLGSDIPATGERPLRAINNPSPTQNILYFHNGGSQQYCLPQCGGQTPPLLAGQGHTILMNVLPTDPEYGEAPTESTGAPVEFTNLFARMDAPLALPVLLDPETPIEVAVALRSDIERTVELRVEMVRQGEHGDFMGWGSSAVSITPEFTTHTITFPHSLQEALQAGDNIGLYIYTEETNELPIGFYTGAPLDDVQYDPAGSYVKLPILDNPRPPVVITDGRFLPSILLANGTETDEYLNPGKMTAFDLLLLNEGLQEDVVGLSTQFSAPGWSATAYPGDRFQLTPGRTAPLCLEVIAPADAAPNTVVDLNLTATSKNDEEVRTSLTLRLLVTDGVEIEEASCTERIDTQSEDYVDPFSEERGSPAPPAVALLALLAVALLARRRRT